jgi:hypothetical protein
MVVQKYYQAVLIGDVQNVGHQRLNTIYSAEQWKCNVVKLFWDSLYTHRSK